MIWVAQCEDIIQLLVSKQNDRGPEIVPGHRKSKKIFGKKAIFLASGAFQELSVFFLDNP